MVFIFTLSVSLLSADQNLLAPALSPIAAEFGFNDLEKDKCGRPLSLPSFLLFCK